VGVAIFDQIGLLTESFVTTESGDMTWVWLVFQALNLQIPISSLFHLEGLQQIMIHGQTQRVIIVQRQIDYMALLLHQDSDHDFAQWREWAHNFEPNSTPLICVYRAKFGSL
jgi:hypothetical protein